ncbi:bifunctional folylpolyglutamate synthase/dihydrofolate synthase [Gracilibacillus sp. D59]|uniref:bifunctional folylpolyglutamate synthase/dihydrofolate synthase n=1 Tax=Gracilibacillus sp. D59 TaxID=3457434 RepID=UPI003FCC7298
MIQSEQELEDFFASRRKLGIKPGLERLDYLLEKVNHPQKSIPTIHIAGTNGKGSTLTYLKEVLMESGRIVGTFQSPGLPTILDHMAINNHPIILEDFTAILNNLLPIIDEMDHIDLAPSEYEILMIITLLFLKDNVDIAVIETCMGGLEDVTNRVEPLLTIITTVAIDHTSFLGDTLRAIAVHKAGIIKENVPVIVGELDDEALQVVQEVALQQCATLYQYEKEFWTEEIDMPHFLWSSGSKHFSIDLSMKGRHQIMNAALAIQAFNLLNDNGFNINDIAIKKGLFRAKLPNRMEIINENPRIIADGAHNVQSVSKLVETIEEENIEGSIKVLFSAFRDKDISRMIEELSKLTDEIMVTTFDHPRALSDVEIPNHVVYYLDAQQALDNLLVNSNPNDLILITGSLHFVEFIKSVVKK